MQPRKENKQQEDRAHLSRLSYLQRRPERERETRAQLSKLSYLELRQEAKRIRLQGGRFPGLNRADSRQLVDEAERARYTSSTYEPMDWSWIWFPLAALMLGGGLWIIQVLFTP
jgi:hypothetical protein